MRAALRGMVLAACAAAACAAPAADPAGNYAIWGAGARSCNQFGLSAGSAERSAFRHFLMGYLTAYNTLAPETYNALGEASLEDALAWLETYCDTHKLDSFERAVMQLVAAHHAERERGAAAGDGGAAWGRAPAPAAE